MFFIIGVDTKSKQLEFSQTHICSCCGRYGRIEFFMTYTCLSLFFLPTFRWNKRYFAKMSCCGAVCEIPSELGEQMARGEITHIDPDMLNFPHNHTEYKRCECGFETSEDFQFCPKCGRPF